LNRCGRLGRTHTGDHGGNDSGGGYGDNGMTYPGQRRTGAGSDTIAGGAGAGQCWRVGDRSTGAGHERPAKRLLTRDAMVCGNGGRTRGPDNRAQDR